MKGMVNKICLFGAVIFLCYSPTHTKIFEIINNTDYVLSIAWKSSGMGPETRKGKFELKPGTFCLGCIETYDENCVHVLHIQTVDGRYKAWSKPFCKDSTITVSLKSAKNWKGAFMKALDIVIQEHSVKASL